MTIHAGQVLSQRYRLIRPLGQGSQASVWVAEHLALSTQVAVKLIDPELAKKDEARERFRREATAAAQLRSAHVVQILDHGIEGAQPFIVMELLDGEDLFERLERRGRLTLQEAARVVTQVSRALTRAHAAGIVHRDLKPENFYIVANEDDEVVKVLDFGVAKVIDPAKQTMKRTGVGTLIGTPHYMSPEQVKGIGEVDFRTDLWALGVIVFQCVTGDLPFDSEGVGDLLIKISVGEMPVPSHVVPDLSPEFDAWFAKACDRDPMRRFTSARDLAEALARVAGMSTDTPSTSGDSVVARLPLPRPEKVSDPPPPAETASALDGGWGPEAAEEEEEEHGTLDSSELEEIDDVEEIVEAKQAAAKRPSTPPRAAFESHEVQFESEMPPPMRAGAREAPPVVVPPSPLSPRLALPVRAPTTEPRISGFGAEGAVRRSDTPSSNPVRSVPSSTVTGLASVSPPPEFDGGSRRRRMVRFLAIALVALAGLVIWNVVQSQIPPTRPAVDPPPPEPTHEVEPPPPPVPATVAPTASSSADAPPQAVDPGNISSGVAPLPTAPKPTAQPGRPVRKPKDDDMTIEIPLPPEDLPPAP